MDVSFAASGSVAEKKLDMLVHSKGQTRNRLLQSKFKKRSVTN